MLILKNSGLLIATLKIRLAAAKQNSDLEFYTSYYDGPSSSYGDYHGSTNGTTSVTMVSPTIGQYRQVKYITVFNSDSQLSTVILEIVKTDGSTTETIHLHTCTLDEGDTLNYTENEGYRVTDQNGKLKVTVAAGGGGGGGSGTVTSVSVANAHGFSGTVSNPTTTPAISIIAGNITPTSVTASGTISGSNLSGTNTGDQDLSNYFNKTVDDTDDLTEGSINKFASAAEKTKLGFITITQTVDLDTLESDTTTNNAKVSNATHSGDASGSTTLTVTGINGVQLSLLGTGILKNTTGTGVPSIANTGDFPTLNQNTTGSAATLTTARNINGVAFDGSANITVTADANTLTGTVLASGVTSSSLTSVGTLTGLTVTAPIVGSITGNAATVTTNANLTGNVTSIGNATTISNNVVSNAMLATVATNIIKGRVTAGTGNVEDLSPTAVTALLDIFTSSLKGVVPASGGGTSNFLRADGTWAEPPSGGGGGSGVSGGIALANSRGFAMP